MPLFDIGSGYSGGSGRGGGGGAPTTRPLSLLGSGLLAGVPGPPANLQERVHHEGKRHTECPRSLYLIYIIIYCIKWVKTSFTEQYASISIKAT